MQLDEGLAAPAKCVIKMTGKAKAVLEDKASSKKRKPDGRDNINPLLPKKAKKNVPAGSMTLANNTSSPSPTPLPVMSRRAIVRTEKEEEALHEYINLDNNAPANADKDPEEQLMKEWNSPVYVFFDPTLHIVEIADRRAHEFKCQARGCKVKVRWFLNKGNARSTGNMQKHVRLCWGGEVLKAADSAKDADEVHLKIVGSIL
ncbi:hypothetical protein C8R48DRAFT_777395 [Suillus tomentosus]|nr:hypothetical protein C8R48DRAFT_777395 [Suillus tomentosus]